MDYLMGSNMVADRLKRYRPLTDTKYSSTVGTEGCKQVVKQTCCDGELQDRRPTRCATTHNKYKYVRPHNTRTEMYTGRVACCFLMSHVEYAPIL